MAARRGAVTPLPRPPPARGGGAGSAAPPPLAGGWPRAGVHRSSLSDNRHETASARARDRRRGAARRLPATSRPLQRRAASGIPTAPTPPTWRRWSPIRSTWCAATATPARTAPKRPTRCGGCAPGRSLRSRPASWRAAAARARGAGAGRGRRVRRQHDGKLMPNDATPIAASVAPTAAEPIARSDQVPLLAFIADAADRGGAARGPCRGGAAGLRGPARQRAHRHRRASSGCPRRACWWSMSAARSSR